MMLDELNALSREDAAEAFDRCCHSAKWVEGMCAHRPFQTINAVYTAAESVAEVMENADWLEAFTGHPKIGDTNKLRERFAKTAAWSEGEQAGVDTAHEETIRELARLNAEYESRFGYIFIVCASGKSAEEMLAILRSRIDNAPSDELNIAAGEQRKITRIRLEKLLT